ncbi:MAG TPA: hypothetical protein VMC07_03285 [Candidatus Omnitrophota bacterium]|nr:hypothetical protein [Candidatus Omnitrophota bacterium]
MAKPTIEEVAADLSNVLEIANHFSYLWGRGAPLYGEDVIFTDTSLAQDESWHMAVQQNGDGKFSFKARYTNGGLSVLESSRIILDNGYTGEPGTLAHDFKECLMKPLGEYLAKKEMEKLGQ